MLKKTIYLLVLVLGMNNYLVIGQSNYLKIENIKASNDYYWGEENGAQNNSKIKAKAIQNICISIPQSIYQVEELSKKVTTNQKSKKLNTKYEQTYEDNTTKISFCDLFEAETIYDEKNKKWFAYIKKSSINNKFNQFKERFYNLFETGKNAHDNSEKLRNYYWASQILTQIPGGNDLLIENEGDSTEARGFLYEEINQILNNITCRQTIIDKDKTSNLYNTKLIKYSFYCFDEPFKHFNLTYQIGTLNSQKATIQNGDLTISMNPDLIEVPFKKILFIIDYSYSGFIHPSDIELRKIIDYNKNRTENQTITSSSQKSLDIPIGELKLLNIPKENNIKINGTSLKLKNNNFERKFIEGDYKFTIERKKFETKSINFTIENDDIKTYDLSLNDYQLQKYLGGPGNGVLSMLLPGLGTYYVTKKSSSFITTSAFILSVLAAIYTQNQSNQIRDKYLAAQDPGNIANLYRAAQEQHTISLVFSGIATTIYLVDVIHAFSKGTKNKRRKVIAP